MSEEKSKILFLSPEVAPFAKSGGLADVAGSLPLALKRLGLDVRMVVPYYRIIKEGDFKNRLLLKDIEIPLGEDRLKADIFETSTGDGLLVYLIEREDLYDRPNLYGNSRGDYYDNIERFTFFAHAALRLAEKLAFKPDVVHCHDWQTGLVPALLKGPYKRSRYFSGAATVFTIHNMGYQGVFPADKLSITGLARSDFFRPEGMEYWGNISLLKAGIVYSEAITTVSPTYAKEIQTPEYGLGMEGVLQHRRESLWGILNGVDYDQWNPDKDPHTAARYSPKGLGGKMICKESLIKEMGLAPSLMDKPLLGMISRLDEQKGLDILVEALDKVLLLDVGLVILGSGRKGIQDMLHEAARHSPERVGVCIGFDEPLAHRIMAGADILLIPSRYEPCGLTQMYALKYGTVPVVRETGGLNDTITNFDIKTGRGNGFKFGPSEASAFLHAIKNAVNLFKDQKVWKTLMANGMQSDFSWDRSAETYIEIYRSILKGSRGV